MKAPMKASMKSLGPVTIGDIALANPVLLAPMSGVTDAQIGRAHV